MNTISDRKAIYLIFGGESPEHEISIITAKQALKHLDSEKYEVFPIYLDKQNNFFYIPNFNKFQVFKDFIKLEKIPLTLTINKSKINFKRSLFSFLPNPYAALITCHGGIGEGGSLQGFFDMYKIAYTGPSLRGAVYAMDKVVMKEILEKNNIEILPWIHIMRKDWDIDKQRELNKIKSFNQYPLIVKPASLGSSIGVAKVVDDEGLIDAIEQDFLYDRDIVIEKFGENMKEINCSVARLDNVVEASELEEVNNTKEVFSYSEKYLKGGKKAKASTEGMASAARKIPAQISAEHTKTIKELAKKIFLVLQAESLTRVDFLLDVENNKIYPIEINSTPGSLSYYLWEATGMQFSTVIDKLIEDAIQRRDEQSKILTSFDSPLWES